jgi:hypothetical protein
MLSNHDEKIILSSVCSPMIVPVAFNDSPVMSPSVAFILHPPPVSRFDITAQHVVESPHDDMYGKPDVIPYPQDSVVSAVLLFLLQQICCVCSHCCVVVVVWGGCMERRKVETQKAILSLQVASHPPLLYSNH